MMLEIVCESGWFELESTSVCDSASPAPLSIPSSSSFEVGGIPIVLQGISLSPGPSGGISTEILTYVSVT